MYTSLPTFKKMNTPNQNGLFCIYYQLYIGVLLGSFQSLLLFIKYTNICTIQDAPFWKVMLPFILSTCCILLYILVKSIQSLYYYCIDIKHVSELHHSILSDETEKASHVSPDSCFV